MEQEQGISLDGIKESLNKSENEINETKVFYSATELLKRKVKKLPCLIDPILPKVGVAALAGSSDTGKSSFLRHLASSIVLGKTDFLGWEIKAEHNKVIYVSTEDDDFATSFQLSRFNMYRQLDSEKFSGLKYIFDTDNIFLIVSSFIRLKFPGINGCQFMTKHGQYLINSIKVHIRFTQPYFSNMFTTLILNKCFSL